MSAALSTDSFLRLMATSITAADFHSCALLAGGAVTCLGLNPYGALDDGTATDSSVPVDDLAGSSYRG